MTVGGIGLHGMARLLPKVTKVGAGRLPGVTGMACSESTQVNHGRSRRGHRSRRCNRLSEALRPVWKSERSIVVMTAGTTQPCESEGAVLLQRFLEKEGPVYSSMEVSHAR